MVEHILIGRFLHAIDLKLAVVGVVCGLEVVDLFEEGLFFLDGEGVAHAIDAILFMNACNEWKGMVDEYESQMITIIPLRCDRFTT